MSDSGTYTHVAMLIPPNAEPREERLTNFTYFTVQNETLDKSQVETAVKNAVLQETDSDSFEDWEIRDVAPYYTETPWDSLEDLLSQITNMAGVAKCHPIFIGEKVRDQILIRPHDGQADTVCETVAAYDDRFDPWHAEDGTVRVQPWPDYL